ncbi:MAG: hypothetical protein AAGD25_34195 [Cyanobacteria bacterium P01_F01_bin.150]
MAQHKDSAGHIPITVYTPESRLRQPGVLLREVWTDLQVSRELAWQLFQRQLGTRYRQTALGPLWVLITPIFTALVATMIRGAAGSDATPDATPDAATSATPDAVTDTIPDAATSAIPDAVTDAIPDAATSAIPDAVTDAIPDAATSIPDAVADAIPDAVADAIPDAIAACIPDAVASCIPEDVLPYPIKVFFATIVWGFFSKSVTLPLQAMRESLVILRTMRVAVEGFLMAKIGEILFEQSFQFLVLGVVLLLWTDVSIPFSGLLKAAGLLAIMMAFGMSLGFFIVPIGSLYLDVDKALPLILRLWFFMTPVIYGPPVSETSPYFFILALNPVAPLLQGVLDVSLGIPLVGGWSIVIVSIITVVLFALGWLVYRVSIPLLVER